MRTLGIDLAAEPAKTALAMIEWQPDGARLTELRLGNADADLVATALDADRIGIDAPFGWPDAFVSFLADHHRLRPATAELATRQHRRPLTKRRTDLVVQERTGIVPLSVSADLIAHVALRCAGLLSQLHAAGIDVGRVAGTAVEAYPAAALKSWGLPWRGYKNGKAAALDDLAAAFTAAAPWLDLGTHAALVRRNDDAFDAVVAATIARAAALGAVTTPEAADRAIAEREGWIQLPTGRLADLCSG